MALSKLKQNVYYIQTIGHTVERLDVVDSTNNYAAKLISETKVLNGSVILAKNQTLGRGQQGNSWLVEAGKNITLSVVLNQLSVKSDEQFLISQWISNSVIDLLKVYNVEAEIKWPNDILIKEDNKKIAGILIENSLRGQTINHSIVGLGLNINQMSFEEGINATSICLINGAESNLDSVLDELIQCSNANYLLLSNQRERLTEKYFSNLLGYKKKLNFEDKNGGFSAEVDTVLTDGRLVLLDDNQRKRIYLFKEVSLIL